MPICGHGIDIVATERVQALIDRHGERFLQRCFTDEERAYCEANPRRRVEHYAGRFAAKEAVLKVLGTGWAAGITWRDIAVTRDASGKPGVALTGQAGSMAQRCGITRWWLSLSHIETHAIASALGEDG
jgi:holo-[acyl-carrier protein] synthase